VIYNQIGESGLNEIITRRLTTPGGSAAPAVAPEIFPVLVLESDRPEWGVLKGENPFAVSRVAAAPGVGNFLTHALVNPTGSGVIVVVKRLAAVAGTGLVRVGVAENGTYGAGGVQGIGIPTDSRISAFAGAVFTRRSASSLTELIGAGAVTPSPLWFGEATTNLDIPFILKPGWGMFVATNSSNTALTTNIFWTERKAQPGELA